MVHVVTRLFWILAAVAAFVLPSPGIGRFDGIPFDAPFEAIAVGAVVPLLFALHWRAIDHAVTRALVAALLAVKVLTLALLSTQGWCAEFRTDAAVVGPVAMIDVGEPAGVMRSWDVRAHWGSGQPECSAVMRRDYPRRTRFPAWFMNILDNANAPYGGLQLVLRGFILVNENGQLGVDVSPAQDSTLSVNGAVVTTATGGQLTADLPAGTHSVEIRSRLTGTEWRVVPTWTRDVLWTAALATVSPPRALDRWLWWVMPAVITALVTTLLVIWLLAAIRASQLDGGTAACVVGSSVAMVLLSSSPVARFLPALLILMALTPAARRGAGGRTSMWLVGVPWMVFASMLALPRLDEFTLFSRGDDWLTYQVSAYKIYLQGYWLEAGERLFYYQPFYRWIAGALHLLFGDTSGGETLWDAAGLLIGAQLAFVIVRPLAGGGAAVLAAALTLVVGTISPIWYLIGRGLAEISAAGFAWTAALLLIRSRVRGLSAVAIAGVFGVLAYFTRLNQMLFAGALLAFLLPLDMAARTLREPGRVLRSVRRSHAMLYVGVLLTGLGLLAIRAWYYTDLFSPFAGTSFGLNHTGLAPNTLLSAEVWHKVSHSVFAQMMVNEVIDVRGLPVLAGCVAAILALLQVRGLARLSLAVCAALAGGLVGALVAHAHGYPGRFSVHLVPLACAAIVTAVTPYVRKSVPL